MHEAGRKRAIGPEDYLKNLPREVPENDALVSLWWLRRFARFAEITSADNGEV